MRQALAEGWSSADSDRLESASFTLLILFSALGPLLTTAPGEISRRAMGGGTVALSSNTLLCLLAFLIAALTLLSGSTIFSLRPVATPLAAMTALAVLGAVQLVPFPKGILTAIGPVNMQIYHENAQILRSFGAEAPLPRLSIAPSETIETLLLLLAYLGLFACSVSLLRTRARRRLFAGTILASAFLQILAAAAGQSGDRRLHGSFSNPDHFAAYLEIVLALAFGVLLAEVLINRERAVEAMEPAETFERRVPPIAARILLWGLIAGGIALTESRGGVLAAGFTVLVLAGGALLHRRLRQHKRVATMIAATLLAGAVFAGVAAGASRFSRFLLADPRDFASTTRAALWRTSLEAWREFPWLGSGLGTFREAFRRVQPREVRGLVEQAHNDFLQLAVTGGSVGAALGLALFASLFFLLGRAFLRQRHREESAIALAGLGALLSITLHGLVDFNLSIPIIPATLACVLGCAWAAASRT